MKPVQRATVVKDTRRLRRACSARGDIDAWWKYTKKKKEKKKAIANEKRKYFRQEIAKAAEDQRGIWKLARWAKDKSHLPRELPQFPPLKNQGGTATTYQDNIDVLKNHFFPPPPEADLSNIQGTVYPPEIQADQEVKEEEIATVISRLHGMKAPGPDGIINWIIQLLLEDILPSLPWLFQACVTLAYHPESYREANTIVLRKPNKGDYTLAKAYRPIAPLNTLGKVLEALQGRRLSDLAEKYGLLPEEQMGARRNRSTESALELLTDSVHMAWGTNGNNVASLLCLDIAGAFDKVSHARVLHNMRKKGIPERMVTWVESFLGGRKTTLSINGRKSNVYQVSCGIPQGSPVSPILFLFFNTELFEKCREQGLNAITIGFVDDTNILAYSKSTAQNCRTLGKLHDICMEWARTHGAIFEPSRYELIHLARKPKRFDMDATSNWETARCPRRITSESWAFR